MVELETNLHSSHTELNKTMIYRRDKHERRKKQEKLSIRNHNNAF